MLYRALRVALSLSYFAYVSQYIACLFVCLQVNALDPDLYRSGSIAYSVPYVSSSGAVWSSNVTVNTPELFQSIIANSIQINSVTGVLSLSKVMGRDLPSGFSDWQFSVAANDEAGTATSLVGYGYVNLVLIDINDHTPVFDTCCLNGSVVEGAPAGESVQTLHCCCGMQKFRQCTVERIVNCRY